LPRVASSAVGEGSHFAVSYATTGEESLEYFLRLLLANLMLFRSVMDHPGFDFSESPSQGKAHLRYLTSITQETDVVVGLLSWDRSRWSPQGEAYQGE